MDDRLRRMPLWREWETGSCGEGWAITRPGEQGCRRGRLMGVLEVEKFRQLKERNRQSTEQFYRNGGMGHGTQTGS